MFLPYGKPELSGTTTVLRDVWILHHFYVTRWNVTEEEKKCTKNSLNEVELSMVYHANTSTFLVILGNK